MSTKTNSKSFFSNSNQSQSATVFDTLQNNDASSPLFSSSSSNSIGDFFKSITWQTWIIIIIVLAVLGFNIFIYLAKGTQIFANVIEQVTSWFSGLFGNSASNTAKQTVNVSATGAKAAIDIGANTTTNTINRVSNTNTTSTSVPVGQTASSSQAAIGSRNTVQTNTNTSLEQRQQDSLQTALNDANQSSNVQADDSYSAIQMSKSSGKAGWCLIGAEKGVRSCMEVGVNDQCMSGDIFPSQEICVNPRLRA